MPPLPPKRTDTPVVRLAVSHDGMPSKDSRYGQALTKDATPVVRLAHVPGAQGDNCLLGQRGVAALPDTSLPALLISYWYIKSWLEKQSIYKYRNWMMDSGAFSAYNAGAAIDIDAYIKECHRLKACDPTLVEIIALDVIGDGMGSLKNSHKMRDAGVDAMPVFHIGEDWAILKEYCDIWPKVGLSCRFGEALKKSYWFYDQCFSKQWPHKFHSFGWAGDDVLMRYPFHSSDCSTWEYRPCAFGRWKGFGNQHVPVRGSKQNLRVEVEWWLDFERRLRERWKKEMMLLDDKDNAALHPTVRLVTGTGRSVRDDIGIKALNGEQHGE